MAVPDTAIAAARDESFTLPGVWEQLETTLFIKEFNAGAIFIEAHVRAKTVCFKAKAGGVLGGVMHVVQQVGEVEVRRGNQAAIDVAVAALEALLTEHLVQRG